MSDEADELVTKIKDMIIKYNGMHGKFRISYACGYAFSGDYQSVTIMDLLNEADSHMYAEKTRAKQVRDST